MSRGVVIRPKAQAQIDEQAQYIALDNPHAARRFLDALQESFQALAELPTLGRIWESQEKQLEGVRVWRVKAFEKHHIFCRLTESGIEVLHVLHGARDLPPILGTQEGVP